jgi:hypothetical protein
MAYLFSLHHRPWEAVQQEPVFTLGLVQIAVDHLDHQLVRHQLSGVHDFLQLGAQFRARGDFRAEHVAGGQVAHTEFLFQKWRLEGNTGKISENPRTM